MRIAICDDEIMETEKLQALIEDFALRRDCDLRCRCFTSGPELLAQAEKFDLYFLDYKMGEMTGVETALALKEKFRRAVTVCFLTGYETAAMEVINNRVYADGFLKKPVDPALLYDKLEQFYRLSFDGRLELKKGKGFETVYAQDIIYVEADAKRSLLHFVDHTESYNYLISTLAEEVLKGACFCRIHRSFIVNLEHVRRYDAKTVSMSDGTVLPLKLRDFRDVYRDYLFRTGS